MNEKRKKAHIRASLLRNKNVSTVFKEAMNAPMGSTKRVKAQRLARVLRKTITKHDGQGGPGFPTSAPGTYVPEVQTMQADPIYQGMVIFKAPPAPAQPQDVGMEDGQGGPGYSQLSVGNGMGALAGLGGLSLTPAPAPSMNGGNRLTGTGQGTYRAPDTGGAFAKDPSQLSLGNPLATSNFTYDNPYNLGPKPQAPAAAPAPQQNPTVQGPTPGQSLPEITPPEGAGPTYDDTSGGTSSGPAETAPGSTVGFPYLQNAVSDAVGNSTGASTFAYGAMNDINVLRQLFPGVPDEELPVGASLAGQLEKLQSALKREHNIDGLTSNLGKMIQDGADVEGQLKDYIRGKDEYLNEVDDMLRDAKRKAVQMSGSPDGGVYADYVNYLTTLKGRQNKRYIDFYNSSIDTYNGQLKAMQDQLTSATTAYSAELQSKAGLVQDDYNRIFTALTEMYNTVEAAPQKMLELQLLQTQLQTALADTATSAADGVSSEWISEFGNLKSKGVLIDPEKGTFLPQVTSLEPALETILSNGKTDLGGAFRIIGEAISNDIGAGATGDLNTFMSKVKKYEQMLNDLKAAAGSEEIMAKYGYDMTPAVDNLAQTLASQAGSSVSQYVLGNAGNVKSAMKKLTQGKGWFGFGGVPAQDEFVKQNTSATLPAPLLERIYDFYETINAADPSGQSMKRMIALPDDQFAATISQGVGSALFMR